MRVIAFRTLRNNFEKNAYSKIALEHWHEIARNTKWNNLHDIKNTFNSVDYVGNHRFVFNIKGNKYRLVVAIQFPRQVIYIRFIGTHSEYDRIDCKNI